MRTLAAQPDGLLVSAETVADFQLSPGDQINLRLTSAKTGHLSTVPFHYVGVVKEFPTAPRDSFLVADAAYIAKVTGDTAVGAFLVDAGGSNTAAVAAAVRNRLGPTATVTDLTQTRGKVGSSLTAVDLSGLTRIELGFAFALAATAAGLVLALGLTERRRMFTIATTLGATRRHIAGFVVAEAAVILIPAFAFAALTGWALSSMLVTVLHGVFDPPPDHLALPWPYLSAVLFATVAATAATVAALVTTTGTPRLTLLRHTTG
jgi:putative ABC transport system permease protein